MRVLICLMMAIWLTFAPKPGNTHALDPGYLDLRQLTQNTWQVLWRVPDVNGQPMRIDASLPMVCTPAQGPQPIFDSVAWVTSWVTLCKTDLMGHPITIKGLEGQNNDVLLRVQPLKSAIATLRFTPAEPTVLLPQNPNTWSVFTNYFWLGFEHILEGWDHLLFVFALFILVRNPWRLVGAVTAFTVAHSVTLALATLGVLRVPAAPVEAIIALSILFLALEILKHRDGQFRLSEQYPWIVCFCFGLLHGLGFAGALSEIGLPSQDIPAALLAFNLGVEAGQLIFVTSLSLGIYLWRQVTRFESSQLIGPARSITGYAIGCVSVYWLVERVSGF
ncbi:HupE / UreJ protein [Ruegeria denitrificans]|uniref:HupE / UreJ protein n=1 Tax=Ruegeria denitrificans TaxID=1715692 RepID=A0A0N7MAW4_9RHOB|nr:HupE/UreJ family protein [Ruegeria denitrificans]CUK17278.1 HupE / UreJ protein [Ruegeria denitrificans]